MRRNVDRVVILKTPLTMPERDKISTPAKMGDKVSVSGGMSVARVIALPSSGTQWSKCMVLSTANIFWSKDLNKAGTLTAGACLGMPNSTETLIS